MAANPPGPGTSPLPPPISPPPSPGPVPTLTPVPAPTVPAISPPTVVPTTHPPYPSWYLVVGLALAFGFCLAKATNPVPQPLPPPNADLVNHLTAENAALQSEAASTRVQLIKAVVDLAPREPTNTTVTTTTTNPSPPPRNRQTELMDRWVSFQPISRVPCPMPFRPPGRGSYSNLDRELPDDFHQIVGEF